MTDDALAKLHPGDLIVIRGKRKKGRTPASIMGIYISTKLLNFAAHLNRKPLKKLILFSGDKMLKFYVADIMLVNVVSKV